jgi:transcriptional regulator GlxA family with amidase domain
VQRNFGSVVELRRARDLMDRQFGDDDLTLDRIAAAAYMSKSHFVRMYSRQFGITPAAYLSARRIERAQDLLRFANLTVTEVCHAVGFTSLGSFSTAFTERLGYSPSAYQRRWRGREQPRVPGCVFLMWGPQPDLPTPDRATQEKRP